VNTTTWSTDTVLMPVPLRWAPQVAELLAGLRAGRISQESTAGGEGVFQVPGQGEWSRPMLAELADVIPYAGVLALFDRCAEVAGDWVIKSEVEEAQGISAIQMRNELGALTKLIKRTFKTADPTWPVQVKKEQGSYYYRMDKPVAGWWTDARGQR